MYGMPAHYVQAAGYRNSLLSSIVYVLCRIMKLSWPTLKSLTKIAEYIFLVRHLQLLDLESLYHFNYSSKFTYHSHG